MNKKNTFFLKFFLLMVIAVCWWKSTVISNASERVGTVTLSVEKFTIGQGYLVEPTQVALNKGDTCAKLVEDILKENNYEIETTNGSNGWYLAEIKNADNGKTKIPNVIQNMETQINGDEIIYPPDDTAKNIMYPDLCEYSYHSNAGWMYSVNGMFPGVGMAAWTPKDGDVIRVQFTVYGLGADLGSQYSENSIKALNIANKEELTKKIAEYNAQKEKWDSIYGAPDRYNYAMGVLEKLDSKQWKVDDALERINQISDVQKVTESIHAIGTVDLSKESQIAEVRKAYNGLTSEQKEMVSSDTLKVLTDAESKISSLKAEQEAKKKAEEAAQKKAEETKKAQEAAKKAAQKQAQQAALRKKYTPSKPALKSVKKSGKSPAKLTWKKVSNATGYEVYQSVKKNTGYKKIKTITKNKTVTYKAGKLKKKKTYYFKIRTYRKAGGTTYYGAFSSVKKIKIK